MPALNDLTDVTITSLQPNDVLQTVDGASWINVAIGAAAGIQPFNANTSFTDVAEVRSAEIDMDGNDFKNAVLQNFGERIVNIDATANTTLDLEDGNCFVLDHDTNITTFTFTNPAAAGTSSSFTLVRIKDDSATVRSIVWPTSVVWPEGTAPTLTDTAEAIDIFEFFTLDGGTTWYGFVGGLNLS